MQKRRFFLKGSLAESRWLNRQVHHGWQLTAVRGCHYQFKPAEHVVTVMTEYVPVDALKPLAAQFKPLASYTYERLGVGVVYTGQPVISRRVVTADDKERLKVTRWARDLAINSMNAWVIGLWLLMCAAVFGSAQGNANAVLTNLLLGALGIGGGLMLVGMIMGGRLALRYHRQVRQLVQQTGDRQATWQPTLHIQFHHQTQAPDVSGLTKLGKWLPTMHNQRGDYYFDLRTNLSPIEIRNELQKQLHYQDFTVMSWLGLLTPVK